jgi:hypothetical protein
MSTVARTKQCYVYLGLWILSTLALFIQSCANNVSGCLFSYLWGSNRCIKSKGIVGPQSLSLVNSSNLLCKLLWFFFIYIYRLGKSCVLNNWFDLVESKNFFLNFFHGMKRFADSFIIHLHFFVSVDLWSRSRFPIYYQHHQLLLINLVEEIKFL